MHTNELLSFTNAFPVCRTATALTGSTPAPLTLSSPRWEPIATQTSRVNAPHAPSPAATCAPGRRPVPRSCSCCAKRSRIASSWRNWSVTVVLAGTMAASPATITSHTLPTSKHRRSKFASCSTAKSISFVTNRRPFLEMCRLDWPYTPTSRFLVSTNLIAKA